MTTRQRRRHPRIYQPIEVSYTYRERQFRETTRSLSMGGLYVGTPRPLEVGATFMLDFALPGLEHPFSVQGEVIWRKLEKDRHGPPGMGVRFTETRQEDQQALLRYLAHSQVTHRRY